MSPDRRLAVLACALCVGTSAVAQEDGEELDAEFLEYLGMWEESDEEWLLHEENLTADVEERSDPVPDGEESTEQNDES
ncbi:MAG: hypothetical protein QNJ11_00710 [Woeseiaceae bacterium]|nr:hypothetical protein [Woeseiaceae bacterium]